MKGEIQTWNHLAWRRDAKAVRHFCLSRTSGGSLTESDSSGGWNKKTRYSLTKGEFCQPARGEHRQPSKRSTGRMGEGRGTPPLQGNQHSQPRTKDVGQCQVQQARLGFWHSGCKQTNFIDVFFQQNQSNPRTCLWELTDTKYRSFATP